MDYKDFLNRNVEEFIRDSLTIMRKKEFIVFLKEKNYSKEDYTIIILELLKNNPLVANDEECLRNLSYFAVKNNCANLLAEMLKKYKFDPMYEDKVLLTHAIENNYVDIVEVLLNDSRVNFGRWVDYYIRLAMEKEELLTLLLTKRKVNLEDKQIKEIREKYSNNKKIMQALNV